MKKILYFLIFFFLVMPIYVKADSIYNIDMNINLLEDGTANITEIWDVEADSGSEWYKQLYNMGDSELSNFIVYMDGEKLEYNDNWNVNDSLYEKAGYYGINYTSDGLELCFGKSDMDRHTFILTYTLSNFIFNTDDSQVLYWTLFPNVTVSSFSVTVSSYYLFPDTLDVWGYGYKGYAYVKDGIISMSNEGPLNNEYVVLLVKFPLETFDTSYRVDGYNNFDDIYQQAEDESFEFDYYEDYYEDSGDSEYLSVFAILCNFLFYFLIALFVGKGIVANTYYGYAGNKTINKKDVPMFRDIPCDKDIYYANTLIKLNNFGYKSSNILGAILLKWIRNDKIGFKTVEKGIFNKDTSIIDLSKNPTFDNDIEQRLFNMMKEASKDEMLETKEFTKWCKNNYSEFLGLFTRIENDTIGSLKSKGYIYNRTDKNECKYKNVMNDKMYNDSVQLYGLKKYLKEFSRIDTKEVMEVKLWDEYLMFAYLYGIADKVLKQLKDMYPEVLQPNDSNINSGGYWVDYDMLLFINNISSKSVYAASSARSAAESYTAGGGGFSSGGGGGGSFGGGGSMGGR